MNLTLMDAATEQGVRVEVRSDMLSSPAMWPGLASDPLISNDDLLAAIPVWAGPESVHEPGRGLRDPEEVGAVQAMRTAADVAKMARVGGIPQAGGRDSAAVASSLPAMLLSLGPWPLRHKATSAGGST